MPKSNKGKKISTFSWGEITFRSSEGEKISFMVAKEK